jgi:heat shock protein HspQ
MKDPTPRFEPGQLVHHKRYDYRGVIVSVDANCQADEAWYQNNQTQPARNQPWYHVLVDGSHHTTYVAEGNLELDRELTEINHPLLRKFFRHFLGGRYHQEPLN